jgi:capsular exopolysaccharide synthesis family protein
MMSRIQNILDKAERDGTLRPMGAFADPTAIPRLAALDPPQAVIDRPSADFPEDEATLATGVADVPAMRVLHGVRLAPTLVAALAPDAVTAEQYRSLRTRLVHADNGHAVDVMLVTSPGRSDGKSVTAVNLGLAMAQEDQRRIVIVDANLRSPRVHHLLGIPQGPGLGDVLAGGATLEDALVTIEEHQITVLPAGDPASRPAELLGTMTMRRTLETLRSRFDRVVIDAPAAAPLADVGILMPLVDGVVLVVRAGITSKPAIQAAIAAVDRDKLLGAILNESTF